MPVVCITSTHVEYWMWDSYVHDSMVEWSSNDVYCHWKHHVSRTLLCQVPLSCSIIAILLYNLVYNLVFAFDFCTIVTSQNFTCILLLYTTVTNKYSYSYYCTIEVNLTSDNVIKVNWCPEPSSLWFTLWHTWPLNKSQLITCWLVTIQLKAPDVHLWHIYPSEGVS